METVGALIGPFEAWSTIELVLTCEGGEIRPCHTWLLVMADGGVRSVDLTPRTGKFEELSDIDLDLSKRPWRKPIKSRNLVSTLLK